MQSLLIQRWKKAVEMLNVARTDYSTQIAAVRVPVSETMVEKWIAEERNYIVTDEKSKPKFMEEWNVHYFHMLHCYYTTRDNLMSNSLDEGDRQSLGGKVCSMENQLIDFERQHGIVMRWKTIDKQYIDARNNFLLEKKRRIEASLWSSVIKRHYLLKMKAKYADGQKIAKKLSSSIRKEMKRIGAIVEEYNATVQDKITVAEVLPPDSSFWKQSPITTTDEGIPWALKRSTAQALLVMKRSKEEIELLRQEMRNVINYWKHRQRCITDFISEQSDTSRFDRGARSLLLKSMWESEVMLEKSTVTFAPVFAHSDIDHEFVQESENSDLHFESDSDSGQSSESDGE